MSSEQNTIQGVKANLTALTTLVQEKNTAISQFNSAVTQRIKVIKGKIDELKRTYSDSAERLKNIERELEGVRSELNRSQGVNAELKRTLEELQKEKVGTVQEIQAINGQISEIRELVTQINPQNPDLNSAVLELEQLVNGSGSDSGRGFPPSNSPGTGGVSAGLPSNRREDARRNSFNLGESEPVEFSDLSRLNPPLPIGETAMNTKAFRGGKKNKYRKSRIIKCRTKRRTQRRQRSTTLKRKQRGGFLAVYKQPVQSKKDKKDKKSKKDKKKSSKLESSSQSDNNDAYNF